MTAGDPSAAGFSNLYEDRVRADAYASLEFPATYALAFRDLFQVITAHLALPPSDVRALDFGCGAGRSTRFLAAHGVRATGVDIAEPMLRRARERDPEGEYLLIPDGGPAGMVSGPYDLITAIFPFDNVPTRERKVALFASLRGLLSRDGILVALVSSPELYVNEWVSFSTREFPENRAAVSGDRVRIVMLDVEDRRPVEDILCTGEEYAEVHRQAGLRPVATYRPLGRAGDPDPWVSELTIAPWVVYVLGRAVDSPACVG